MNPIATKNPHYSYERILESIQQGIIHVDNDDVIIYANESFCESVGYTKHELAGKVAHILLGQGRISDVIKEKIKNRKNSITEEYEVTLFRKDGQPVHYNMKGFPLKDDNGNVTGSVGIHIDVTERKKIEGELILSEKTNERLRELVANMNEVFFSIDLVHNQCLFISSYCEEMYGYTAAEFMEDSTLCLDIIAPQDREMVLNRKNMSAGEPFNVEYRVIKKDENISWVEARIIPVVENGITIRLDGFVSDINKRKKAEIKLQQKMNELNTFTYKASHDLRSPLISLLGLVKLATRESKDPSMDNYFRMIGESTQKMEIMLQELTSVALITQGELRRTEINFNKILQDVLESIKFLPGFEMVRISSEIELHKPFYSDKQSVHSILFNLISNSIKYRDVQKKSRVHISIKEEKDGVQIFITDNGIGIQTEFKERVFEMFYRATELSAGSGLGLYIVSTTLEKLDGKVVLNSEEGSGTDFAIHLPMMK